MSFETRLATLRKRAGLTQVQLAEALGTAQSMVSQLEAGARRPSYEMLQTIARSLGVTVGYLLSGELEGLSSEEEAHFQEYRSLRPEAREELRAYARYLQHRERIREPGGDE